jgi:hypothetical protein
MKADSRDTDQPLSDRKIGDRAFILPLVGFLLLTPPLAGIFQLDIRILGIPFTWLYLFGVWGALITGAVLLARRIQKRADWQDSEDIPGSDKAGDIE